MKFLLLLSLSHPGNSHPEYHTNFNLTSQWSFKAIQKWRRGSNTEQEKKEKKKKLVFRQNVIQKERKKEMKHKWCLSEFDPAGAPLLHVAGAGCAVQPMSTQMESIGELPSPWFWNAVCTACHNKVENNYKKYCIFEKKKKKLGETETSNIKYFWLKQGCFLIERKSDWLKTKRNCLTQNCIINSYIFLGTMEFVHPWASRKVKCEHSDTI